MAQDLFELVEPRADVLEGVLSDSVFAASLDQVVAARRRSPTATRWPSSMEPTLCGAAQPARRSSRASGWWASDGAPVVRLETNLGGGEDPQSHSPLPRRPRPLGSSAYDGVHGPNDADERARRPGRRVRGHIQRCNELPNRRGCDTQCGLGLPGSPVLEHIASGASLAGWGRGCHVCPPRSHHATACPGCERCPKCTSAARTN